jgi:hypothetical protein
MYHTLHSKEALHLSYNAGTPVPAPRPPTQKSNRKEKAVGSAFLKGDLKEHQYTDVPSTESKFMGINHYFRQETKKRHRIPVAPLYFPIPESLNLEFLNFVPIAIGMNF